MNIVRPNDKAVPLWSVGNPGRWRLSYRLVGHIFSVILSHVSGLCRIILHRKERRCRVALYIYVT